MDNYQEALLEQFYTSRSLKGFKKGVLTDICDLLKGNYSTEGLKQDFDSWCSRNHIANIVFSNKVEK